MGLGPVAVLPECQRQGIGAALIHRGLAECRRLNRTLVVVLGHPAYYPRFGFRPGSTVGLRSEYLVPDEVFMALELSPGWRRASSGLVRYHPAFAAV
jgi:putative acetyltransferase